MAQQAANQVCRVVVIDNEVVPPRVRLGAGAADCAPPGLPRRNGAQVSKMGRAARLPDYPGYDAVGRPVPTCWETVGKRVVGHLALRLDAVTVGDTVAAYRAQMSDEAMGISPGTTSRVG
jgi:hypothetical protein